MSRLLLGGWGRQAAWAVLILFLILQAFAGWLFEGPRLALFDAYQRHWSRRDLPTQVVIVAIDDDALKQVGQWPWPHRVIADLLAGILKQKPLALGIDMLWAEPDRQSPEQWLKEAGDLPPALTGALRQLPRNDALLGQVLSGSSGDPAPVVLGIGGISDSKLRDDAGDLAPVFLGDLQTPKHAQDPPAVLPSFGTTLRSLPELDQKAIGHGVLSVVPDPDGVFRRLPMMSRMSGHLAPALVLEMLRIALSHTAPAALHLYYDHRAIIGTAVGEMLIPTQRDGSIWINFSFHEPQRFISASRVLGNGNPLPPDVFRNKLVLLGMTGLGQLDQRTTPLGIMPGVEIHAQLLEDILLQQLARRPAWTLGVELALTGLTGLFLIILLPLLRARWQLVMIAASLAAMAALGIGLWRVDRILLDVATPLIGQGATMVAFLAASLAQVDRQRRRLKLAAARTEGEMEAARRIQAGILPSPDSVAGDPRFELDALMIPARQIGGDLFDFFKMDADHLFFTVGDVSGKGVPAALFMALGKSLCKSCVLRGETDIGAIIDRTNRELSRDNPETLFITLFAGILNLATGELRFCNAGHDAPFLLRASEAPHSLDSVGGPPLCIVEDFSYPAERFQLQPGDMLCVITDGITEAMTVAGEMMGRERAQTVLASLPPGAGPAAAARALHDAVDVFVAGAEPSDDLTILAVRWRGAIGP